MADRPIIFSGPMVKALLAGRKSQTRRIYKVPSGSYVEQGGVWAMTDGCAYGDAALPYAIGDRLYVRETHALVPSSAYRMSEGVMQAVDPSDRDRACVYRDGWERCAPRWRPSIHMPRWASRLTLTVTDVRVQRLQDISEADAIAEGIVPVTRRFPPLQGCLNQLRERTMYEWSGGWSVRAADAYAALWNSLHGPGAWDANPWVVAVTFDVVRQNIGQLPGVAG